MFRQGLTQSCSPQVDLSLSPVIALILFSQGDVVTEISLKLKSLLSGIFHANKRPSLFCLAFLFEAEGRSRKNNKMLIREGSGVRL